VIEDFILKTKVQKPPKRKVLGYGCTQLTKRRNPIHVSKRQRTNDHLWRYGGTPSIRVILGQERFGYLAEVHVGFHTS